MALVVKLGISFGLWIYVLELALKWKFNVNIAYVECIVEFGIYHEY